jgi:hypothetical protein
MDTLSPPAEVFPIGFHPSEKGSVSDTLISQSTASAAPQRGQPWRAIIDDLIQSVQEDPLAKDNFPCQFGLAAHSLAA